MGYATGSPIYASYEGQSVRYASVDGQGVWTAPDLNNLVAATRRFNGTNGYNFMVPAGTQGYTFEWELENWEPASASDVWYLIDYHNLTIVQRLNGTNGYALQAQIRLDTGSIRYVDMNAFNSAGWKNGILRVIVTTTACYVELSGNGLGSNHTTGTFTKTPTEDVSGLLMVDTASNKGIRADVKRLRFWNTFETNFWAPNIAPNFEFVAGPNFPGQVGSLVGAEPSVSRYFDGRPFDHYGRGVGEVILHYDPTHAILNTSNYVLSFRNEGGMVSAYNNSKTGTGNLTISGGNKVLTPNGASAYFNLNNSINLVGKRVFFVLHADAASTGTLNIAGANLGSADGQRSNIQWIRASNTLQLVRWNGTSMVSQGAFTLPRPMTDKMSIYEVEIIGGQSRLWVDGTFADQKSSPAADFPLSRYLSAYNSPVFQGLSGDFIIMNSDGGAQSLKTASDIRNYLANRYGISIVT